MSGQHHHIKKQTFRLEVSGKQDTFKLQQAFSSFFWEKLAPRMEQLFDRLTVEETVVRVDRLVVDLGNISFKSMKSPDGINKLIRALELSLTEKISLPAPGTVSMTRSYSHWEQWLYFLSHGSLPWATAKPDEDWHENILKNLVIEPHAIDSLKKTVKSTPGAMKRLVWQHPEKFQLSILEIFTGHPQRELLKQRKKVTDFLIELSRTSNTKESTHGRFKIDISRSEIKELSTDHFWSFIWVQTLLKEKLWTSSVIIAHWLHKILHRIANSEPQKLLKAYAGDLNKNKEVKKWIDRITDTTIPESDIDTPERLSTPDQNKKATSDRHQGKFIKSEKDNYLASNNMPVSNKPYRKADDAFQPYHEAHTNTEAAAYDWYLQHAGMILIHTFLPRFFTILNLCKEGKFINDGKRQKAIHLLHHIATGDTQPPEYELVLFKFLCGVPINMPVKRIMKLTTKEKQETRNLLETAIAHWEILGKTSVAGLRESFFHREGKLQQTARGWQLIVEQNSIDVLLDKLPWHLGIVKLPWMDEILKVEWR